MILPLELVKKHLNIDIQFEDDDEYLLHLCESVEDVLLKDIEFDSWDEVSDYYGYIPRALQHAILLQVGDYYNVRENDILTTHSSQSMAYNNLIQRYKNFENSQI